MYFIIEVSNLNYPQKLHGPFKSSIDASKWGNSEQLKCFDWYILKAEKPVSTLQKALNVVMHAAGEFAGESGENEKKLIDEAIEVVSSRVNDKIATQFSSRPAGH